MKKDRKDTDGHAPDGIFCFGWRLVRPGGWVKGAGSWFQGDCLLPFVGSQVYVFNLDYWMTEADALTEPNGKWIGKLSTKKERKLKWKKSKPKN